MTIEHVNQAQNGQRAALCMLDLSPERALREAKQGMSMVLVGGTLVPEYWQSFADTVLQGLEIR